MTLVLTRGGVVARKGILDENGYAYLRTLEHCYTPRVGSTKRCSIFISERQQNGIDILRMPRDALRHFPHTRLVDKLPPEVPWRDDLIIDPDAFLYDDQRVIVSHIAAELRSGGADAAHGTASLLLRAGYGKTFVAAGLIATMRVRALFVVSSRELARQALDDMTMILPENSIKWADNSERFAQIAIGGDCAICIVVINTLMLAHFDIAAAFSLVVFDEVHSYCTGKRIGVFWMTQTRFMFGMSATIGDRRDGFDFAVEHHLPPLINAENIPGFSYGTDSQFSLRVRAINYNARPEYAKNLRHESTGEIFTHYMYEQFERDPDRRALIVEEARRLILANHATFIFVEERSFAESIARDIIAAGIVPAANIAIFYGGVDDDERAGVIDGRARIVVATYGYSGTGVSIVRMTAAILASPRYSNMKQIVGRILRRGGDAAKERVVVDIIDGKTCLARQFRLRSQAYDFYRATYERCTVHARATTTAN